MVASREAVGVVPQWVTLVVIRDSVREVDGIGGVSCNLSCKLTVIRLPVALISGASICGERQQPSLMRSPT